jgi:rRNA maturation endonuclease Nob1
MVRRKRCPLCEALAVGFYENEVDADLHQLSLEIFDNGHVLIESYIPGKGKRACENLIIEADINFCPICGKPLTHKRKDETK